jgi:glucuronoarabinoxylan endo-1,4-beta-xylanase
LRRTSTIGVRTTVLLFSVLLSGSARAATATIDWTNTHQEIDGFGAADAQTGASMSTTNQAFFFGTGAGQLGLSLLRVGVTNGSGDPGDCTTVSSSCAGVYVSDIKAIAASGGRIYSSPWSPPAAYKTNGLSTCTAGAGLATADYALYATWLANFATSVKTYAGVDLYAMSLQNEPDECTDYDSAVWTGADIDTFVKTNLGPTFATAGLTTLVFVPEGSNFGETSPLGDTCGGDASCNKYVGGINWHDYDAKVTAPDTVNATPYPSSWPAGKKFWETEASCGDGFGPNFCESGVNTDINDALGWAAVVDDRLAVENVSAWLYWWLINQNTDDDEGLIAKDGTIAKRAYMLGQYSHFIRPGYTRIDATHAPQSGVSVSAYQNTSGNNLVIVATNYNTASVSQTFSIENAPSFTSVTPWLTSATASLAAQTAVAVAAEGFTYTLPASSITTFVGAAPPVMKDGGGGEAGDASSHGGSEGGVGTKDGGKSADSGARKDGGHVGTDASGPGEPDSGNGVHLGDSGSGCGCRVGRRAPGGAGAIVGVALLAGFARRRRRLPS